MQAANASEGTDKILDARNWKKHNAPNNVWHFWFFGGDNAEGQTTWSLRFNRKSFCRQPNNTAVTVEMMDRDTGSSDDHMGTIHVFGDSDYAQGVDLGDGRVAFALKTFY